MFVVETVARIRRAHFVQGKSIKLICRELRVSRKVVRKVLRSAATEFHYEREQQPRPRLGAWRERAGRAARGQRGEAGRERLTLMRVFEALRGSGLRGRLRRGAAVCPDLGAEPSVARQRTAYVPLSFAPGEAYQFDWSHEVVLINGTTVTVKVAHVQAVPQPDAVCPRLPA